MILGSYHMDNPGRDLHNMEADDVLAHKRQAEMKALVEKLAAFSPTKIAVEVPYLSTQDEGAENRKHSSYVSKYADYLAGKGEPDRNEVYQVAFRLAKRMGHKEVYGIDAAGRFDYGRVAAFAQKNGQEDLLHQGTGFAQEMVGSLQRLLSEMALPEYFAIFNEPSFIESSHSLYLKYFLPVGGGEEYPGADLVADWYARNIRIFANLRRILEKGKEERVLVLYGAGHAHILRQLTLETPGFELVEPRDFL